MTVNFTEVSPDDLAELTPHIRSKWLNIINEFLKSDLEIAEVHDCGDKSSAYRTLRATAQRHNLPVTTVIRGNRLFLVRVNQ